MAGKPARPTNAIDQTRRMLSLVTYLRERPGARVEDVARAFGITEDELISDLDVLPHVRDQLPRRRPARHRHRRRPHLVAQPRRRRAEPLRLAADEATALLVAARAVATLPGLRESDRQALLRATAKVEAAAGEAAGASARLSVTFESEGGVFADVDRAISERRRLWIRYYSPGAGRAHRARGRPDPPVQRRPHLRGGAGAASRRPGAPSGSTGSPRSSSSTSRPTRREIELRDLSEGLVQPAAEDPEVVVEVGPGGRWVAEYYPHDSAEELPDGGLRITLRTPDPASLRRLALRLGRDGRIVVARRSSRTARGRRP